MSFIPRLTLALALGVATPALAEERITDFVSDVHVQPDGALDVVETISLVSEGSEIQRGIQRDFPTRYRGYLGGRATVGFDVVDVSRDGRPEPYRLMNMQNGKRVRIGDADTMLPDGAHVYRIHYRTTRQLGFYRDFDELYWNATGSGWTFPIERAEARITLPGAIRFGKRATYTGPQGSTAHDAVVIAERPGRIIFRTTRPLGREEGLTVAVAWPKGVIAEPGLLTRIGRLAAEVGPMLLAIAALLAVLAYCGFRLVRAWRNPNPRPLVPLFSPPEGLSAAAVRYVWRMGFDDRTFSAAIVDSAVRGALRIVETSDGSKPARKLEQKNAAAALPPAEGAMVGELFKGRKSVALKQSSYSVLGSAQSALQERLDEDYGNTRSFSDAGRQKLHGWMLVLGPLLLIAFVLGITSPIARLEVVLGLGAGVPLGFFCLRLLSRGRKKMSEDQWGRKILSVIASILIGMALFQACIVLLALGATSGNPLPLLPPLIAIPFVIVAWNRLRAPTAEFWPIRAEIEGFRHYLATAEEDRLEKLNPPEKTAALFERYLPYAVALDIENRWAERFSGVLAVSATDEVEQDATRDDDWYVADKPISSNPGIMASAVGSSLTSTIVSAATAPGRSGGGSSSGSSGSSSSSSSSSSSGGGSSGGGGGGGGGSGW